MLGLDSALVFAAVSCFFYKLNSITVTICNINLYSCSPSFRKFGIKAITPVMVMFTRPQRLMMSELK